jgi:hypothetical protein
VKAASASAPNATKPEIVATHGSGPHAAIRTLTDALVSQGRAR